MTARQIRRAAERRARKEAQKREKAAAAAPAPVETEPQRTRVDEAAFLSEPKTRQEVNRENAQHSTGPKTPEGKANSSRNSFKHGLYSKQLTNNPEEAAQLDTLRSELRAEHQPANTTEEILVNELAEQFWRIRRARQLEMFILKSDGILPHIAAIQRMMSSAERGFHKALTTLRQLQKERGFVPQSKQNHEHVGARPASPEPKAESCSLTGFVPPPCPPDVDPWEWAKVHDPEVYEMHLEDVAAFEAMTAASGTKPRA